LSSRVSTAAVQVFVVVRLLFVVQGVVLLQLFQLVRVRRPDELPVHVEDLALRVHQELAVVSFDLDSPHNHVVLHVHRHLLVAFLRRLVVVLLLRVGVVVELVLVVILDIHCIVLTLSSVHRHSVVCS
jgi:hypothetical protein